MLAFFVLLPIVMYSLYSSLDADQADSGSVVTENGKHEEVTYEIRETEEKVKSGTSSEEEGNTGTAAVTVEHETEAVKEDAPEPQAQGEQEKSVEEVSEESIVQLADPKVAAADTEYEENVQVIEHTVKPQETLFRIAMNYYNSQAGIDKIKEWNNLENQDLKAGQILKIPLPID